MSDGENIQPKYESEAISVIVGNMWFDLADTLKEAAHIAVRAGRADEAFRLTWLAEAAYWQGHGDSESPSVKNIVDGMRSATESAND